MRLFVIYCNCSAAVRVDRGAASEGDKMGGSASNAQQGVLMAVVVKRASQGGRRRRRRGGAWAVSQQVLPDDVSVGL